MGKISAANADAMIAEVRFGTDGLAPITVQEAESGDILMQAWVNAEALKETLTRGTMCYVSRSRNRLWHKGETSGQTQKLIELRLDCDKDSLIALVLQKGVACHTGRKSCFFLTATGKGWKTNQEVITPPESLYGEKK